MPNMKKVGFSSLQLASYYQAEIFYLMERLDEEIRHSYPLFVILQDLTMQLERNKILLDFWKDKDEEMEEKFKGKNR